MLLFVCIFALIFLAANSAADAGVRFEAPVGSKENWAYSGHLEPKTQSIRLTPQLRAVPVTGVSKTMTVCGFTVHHDSSRSFPFAVIILDKKWGYAEVRLRSRTEAEMVSGSFTFQIEAYDCDMPPHFTERKFVHIEIGSEFGPKFEKPSYHFAVKLSSAMGTIVGNAVAFEIPRKFTTERSGICKYEIVSPNPVPFEINSVGVISTKMLTLKNKKTIRHKFYVKATDCKTKYPQSTSVPVIVDVFDECNPHWTGLPTTINYTDSNGVVSLMGSGSQIPSLYTCSSTCSNFLIVISAQLDGRDIQLAMPKFCKLDQYSLKMQQKFCDASSKTIDLLQKQPSVEQYDVNTFAFDGSTKYEIDSILKKDFKFGKKFTMMFWLKHGKMVHDSPKEQIVCTSDRHKMNRHHYSVFLHNCKLVVLMRKEFEQTIVDKYEPTEWRFGPMKEICDNTWHHFALSYNEPQLSLQIDGEMFNGTPQIIDDKPLMKLPQGEQGIRVTVGACYLSKTESFAQFLHGNLAGLRLLPDENEASNNVRCMATCGEALLLPHILESMDSQSSVTLLSDSAVVRSHNIFHVLQMFSKLSYLNTNVKEELIGRRNLVRTVKIDAEMRCDDGQVVKIPQHMIDIILQSDIKDPKRAVSHIKIVANSEVSGVVNQNVQLLQNLKFIKDESYLSQLKSCVVRPINGKLRSWEYIKYPVNMIIEFHLTGLNNTYGFTIDGLQSLNIYQIILSNVYFVSTNVTSQTDKTRMFSLVCSINDVEFTNQIIVNVNVNEIDLRTYYIVDDPGQNVGLPSNVNVLRAHGSLKGMKEKNPIQITKSGFPFWVIGVVAAVFVLLFAGVAFIFLKKRARRSSRTRVSLGPKADKKNWIKLKITPNPLVQQVTQVSINKENIEDFDTPNSDESDMDDDGSGEEIDQKSGCALDQHEEVIPNIVHFHGIKLKEMKSANV